MIVNNNNFIPKECVMHILSYLNTNDKGKVSGISHSLNTIASADDLWHTIILKECPKRMIALHPKASDETMKACFVKINRAIIDKVLQDKEREDAIGVKKRYSIFPENLINSIKSKDLSLLKKTRLIRNKLDSAAPPFIHLISEALYRKRHLENLKTALEVGANPDVRARAPFFTTPLMATAYRGLTEAIKLLLESGADPMIKDENGQTAFDWLKQGGHTPEKMEEIQTLLDQYSCKK